jgi:hypothetical protein
VVVCSVSLQPQANKWIPLLGFRRLSLGRVHEVRPNSRSKESRLIYMKLVRKIIAKWRTYKDHADSLNRRAEVESVLWNVAAGKRPTLTQDECRNLALKLGVPSAYRTNHGD